jgi:hypothetical protein
MEQIVREMYEDFLISAECSRYYSLLGEEDHEAQDMFLFIKLSEHIQLCEKAAEACKNYLKNKNIKKLILDFKALGLSENVNTVNSLRKRKNWSV